jgi:hypothetical protein
MHIINKGRMSELLWMFGCKNVVEGNSRGLFQDTVQEFAWKFNANRGHPSVHDLRAENWTRTLSVRSMNGNHNAAASK